jgi:hypothetical protein
MRTDGGKCLHPPHLLLLVLGSWLSLLAINDAVIGHKGSGTWSGAAYQAAYLASYLSFACSCCL